MFCHYYTLLVVPIFICIVSLNIANRNKRAVTTALDIVSVPYEYGPNGFVRGNIAFVVAHPDDESMFFTPTLHVLTNYLKSRRATGTKIFLLSLSTGNYYGQGEARKKEFEQLCDRYGLTCTILDDPRLQDGPHKWDQSVIVDITKKYLVDNKILLAFTFDIFGASGHPNHTSVSYATRKAARSLVPQTTVWVLKTPNRLVKYSGILNLLFHWDSRSILSVAPLKTWKNMNTYKSQLRWYHPFWCFLSSYSYVNSYIYLQPGKTMEPIKMR